MSKEIDQYVKGLIKKVPDTLDNILKSRTRGYETTYYSGNFQGDVFDNFTNIQSEKIFKHMRKYLEDKRLCFVQKKVVNGFDYIVKRIR